ncbi:MAG TPA: alpha-hydroxy acid oxidase, partial [Acidimicrobiales bacterium]|nr:alpha-hydroxy acid oxidase [Acidimicrobiales bacterium]
PGPRWFQLYAGDRSAAESRIRRAEESNFEALVVTVDSPVAGKRERMLRHGIPATSFDVNLRNALRLGPQMIVRPRWLLGRLGATSRGLRAVPLLDDHDRATAATPARRGPIGRGGRTAALSPYTWDDIAWIRERWTGPLLLKGILSGDDARAGADAGADAVIVSNHGGRQLDGAPPTVRVLPEVVAAVGDDCEVLIDGGVRRGADVVKALALGARAVLIGRPYLFALAVAGEAGVERMLELLHGELCRTMVLMGCPSIADLDRSWLRVPEA